MAHELDITNGVASFASARVHAWHRLGTVLPNTMTAQEALDAAHLSNWDVRKMPLFIQPEDQLTVDGVTRPNRIVVPEKYATVRTNPIDQAIEPLGVVGKAYECIQNEEHTDLLDTLVDESGAHFETAGALNGGRAVFASLKLPKTMSIRGHNGEDVTDTYIVAVNSHDGSSAFRLMVTPVRVVCQNTLSAAIGRAQAQFSIRHTSNAKQNIALARQALGMTFKFTEQFEAEAQKMVARELAVWEAEKVIADVFRLKDGDQITDRTKKNNAEKTGVVMKLWTDAPTQENLRGTAYGLYNAITEYTDHFAPVYAQGNHDEIRAARVAKGGDVIRIKNAAFADLSKLARV